MPLAPEPATAGSSRGWWLLTTFVTAVAFGAAGFYIRHRQALAEQQIHNFPASPPGAPADSVKAPPQPEPQPTPPETVPQPDPVKPPTPDPIPSAEVRLDADGTLKAFLAAPDWKTRSRYVIVPDQVIGEMEKRAQASGDGPIEITGFELLFIQGGNHIYNIKTTAMPEGIPITLLATDKGPKVDWEAFISFYEDDFRKFTEGPVGNSGIFPLVVRPDPAKDEAESHFMRFRVFPPLPNREVLAWVRKDSTVMPKLKAIFDGTGTLDIEKVKQQVAQGGIPMVLGLEKKPAGVGGQTFYEITKYEALGWGPRHAMGEE